MPRDLENCEPLERAGGKIIQVRRKMGRARDLYIVHGISGHSRKKSNKRQRVPTNTRPGRVRRARGVIKDMSKFSIARTVTAERGNVPP